MFRRCWSISPKTLPLLVTVLGGTFHILELLNDFLTELGTVKRVIPKFSKNMGITKSTWNKSHEMLQSETSVMSNYLFLMLRPKLLSFLLSNFKADFPFTTFVFIYIFPGEGNGNPLQYSCLENPMDGGAWWAKVHGVAKSRTRLSNFTSLPLTWKTDRWQEFRKSNQHFQYSIMNLLIWSDYLCFLLFFFNGKDRGCMQINLNFEKIFLIIIIYYLKQNAKSLGAFFPT